MANPIHTPQVPADRPVGEPARLDYETVPSTGVRRYEAPIAAIAPPPPVRWGAVIAGLVIAAASQLLLGMLGVAVGLTAVEAADPSPWRALGTGMGIWFGITSLVSLFIGGFAAARLGRVFYRTDGIIQGILTWGTALLLTMFLFSSSAPSAEAAARAMRPPAIRGQIEPQVRGAFDGSGPRAAWYALGGAAVSLLAAVAGGAAGATRRYLDERRV